MILSHKIKSKKRDDEENIGKTIENSNAFLIPLTEEVVTASPKSIMRKEIVWMRRVEKVKTHAENLTRSTRPIRNNKF